MYSCRPFFCWKSCGAGSFNPPDCNHRVPESYWWQYAGIRYLKKAGRSSEKERPAGMKGNIVGVRTRNQ